MKVLFIGDIVGKAGAEYLKANMKKLSSLYPADIVVANGENINQKNGITQSEAEALHWIDIMDARMNTIKAVTDKTPPGAFSEKIFSLDRRVYHPEIEKS